MVEQTEVNQERKLKKRKRKVFSEKNVWSLPVRRKQYVMWDGGSGRGAGEVCRGLQILVSPAGAKSYRSTYYFPGSPKSHSRHLGRVGEMTLEEARDLCRLDRKKAREGIDPRANDPSKSSSFKAAVDDYVNRVQIGQEHNVEAEACRRVLLADTEDWWDRPIATIRHTEIQHRLELIRDGDAKGEYKARPYLANLLYARMKPFFAWCAKPVIGKIKHSPMLGLDKPYGGEARRERPWFKGDHADQAIQTLWTAADRLTDKVAGMFLRVLLLTGKRPGALSRMRWEQIDDSWFWNAPCGHKNKRQHSVPLSSHVARILHPRQQSGFVFPGHREGQHLNADTRLINAIIKAGAMEDFILHGCRHIAETKTAEMKIPHHLRDLLFDHASGRGSGKAYDHHVYLEEMRAAVEQWTNHVEGLVTPAGTRRLRG
jgi:integrase